MNNTTAIIRDRGQLTIPRNIRKKHSWIYTHAVVSVNTPSVDEIVIKPHSSHKEVDWKNLWKQIKRVRAFKGKGKPISLSEFIVKDRETHF